MSKRRSNRPGLITTCIVGSISSSVLACAACFSPSRLTAAETFFVDVSSPHFTLYTDPNTGREVKMGGFSGLAPVPGDRTGTLFHIVTDRGPTLNFGENGKAFVPGYSPVILTVKLLPGGSAMILRTLPLRKPNGDPLSGTPNACYHAEDPVVNVDGEERTRDPDGFDAEGLAVSRRSGLFFMSDEYSPSVAVASPRGTVFLRLVPEGTLCGGERIPTFDILPGVFAKRFTNRGFESIALVDDRLLYTAVQRPLGNPEPATSLTSRHTRILEIDMLRALLGKRDAMRQFVYVTEPNARQQNCHVSDIFPVGCGRFLAMERRTDKMFVIDLQDATDITALEDSEGRLLVDPARTLEQLEPAELAAFGIQPVSKAEVLSGLALVDPFLEKTEGIAVSRGQIVVAPDNDFDLVGQDFTTNPATPIFTTPPNAPRLVTFPLPAGVLSGRH